MAEHRPVLCEETVDFLTGRNPGAGRATEGVAREGVYVDATFGRGGHTVRLLQVLGSGSRVVAIDRDPDAVAAGARLAAADPRLLVIHGPFSTLSRILDELGLDGVQGVMMDLGVSSPQLDDPARGFSFRFDGPLDMRMDTSRRPSAAEWLDAAGETEIAQVLREYGEERHARRIAAAIVAARPITTTRRLVEVVQSAQPRGTPGKHDATRTFQALRMVVNNELGELQAGLAQAFASLVPGGRLAVISFHSLEDRLVKQFFRARATPPALPRRLPVRDAGARAQARIVSGGETASAEELRTNPRARSARLRVLERLAEQAA
jgi:16S rRNA (cytosine1402-N4)-methyltransferase